MRLRHTISNLTKLGILFVFVAIAAVGVAFAAEAKEVIDATAYGTSTQMGKNVSIKLLIYDYSTPQDKQVLTDAFLTGQNQGLVKALEKMKSVGRIQIPGTLGYDVSYIASETMPTGRRIRFVTNRKIAIGEAYRNTPSQAYNLTGGEIEINDQDKSKSTGVLYPAAQLVLNADGDLQIELRKNPWRLSNIIVRGKGKE
jgi:hypothetical protein